MRFDFWHAGIVAGGISDRESLRRISMNRSAALILTCLVAGFDLPSSQAAPEAPPSFEQEIRPLLAKYCVACHGEKKAEAEVNLAAFQSEEKVLQSQKLWKRVWSAVRGYEMPPEKHPQPSGTERQLLV